MPVNQLGRSTLTWSVSSVISSQQPAGSICEGHEALDSVRASVHVGDSDPTNYDGHGATWTDRDHYELRQDARRYESFEFNHAGVLD